MNKSIMTKKYMLFILFLSALFWIGLWGAVDGIIILTKLSDGMKILVYSILFIVSLIILYSTDAVTHLIK